MFESRGFLFVFYAVEVVVILAVVVGLWQSHREIVGQLRDLSGIVRDDLFGAPVGTRGRLSTFVDQVRRLGRLDLTRRYRAKYAVSVGAPCVVCGESTREGHRLDCRNQDGPIHEGCVPSIVRRRGSLAVVRWLHTGQLEKGES